MSRTIRRTRDKRRNKSGRASFVYDWVTEPVEVNYLVANGARYRVLKQGKEYWKAYWSFHNDSKRGWGYPKPLRNTFEGICRAQNKAELAKYKKNPDYEVLTHPPRCLSYER